MDQNWRDCEQITKSDSDTDTTTTEKSVLQGLQATDYTSSTRSSRRAAKTTHSTKMRPKSKYDLSEDLKEKLKDFPDVLHFIRRLQKYIEKQKRKLKKQKAKVKIMTKTMSVQTDWHIPIEDNAKSTRKSEKPKTITEEITEAAQEAVQHNGFVYEETSGLYYDYNSGYYYNAEYGLYYDGTKGIYLKYNEETKEYDYHSQLPINGIASPDIDKKKPRSHRKHKSSRKRRSSVHDAEEAHAGPLEDGECSRDDDVAYAENDRSDSENSGSVEMEHAQQWPPCMRVIVEATTIPSLKPGSLLIVTYEGGSIGREGTSHCLLLPELSCSKFHGRIAFDAARGTYVLMDVGSRNGTFLNGARLSPAKVESEPHAVAHGSRIQIGSTVLLCHVHAGTQTCGHCEPGLLQQSKSGGGGGESQQQQQPVATKTENYKRQLKHLRKKFALSQNDAGKTIPGDGYHDRAQQRRVKVGSQNPYEKTQASSLTESIAADNKGYALLSKMGWKEGQALGKESQGMLEPVELISNPGTSGMGAMSIDHANASQFKAIQLLPSHKSKQWTKAQERFNDVKDVHLTDIFAATDATDY